MIFFACLAILPAIYPAQSFPEIPTQGASDIL